MSQQIPSLDWIRRTNPLDGTEDLLKQNPSSDSFPQEERIPSLLVSDYTISNINLINVGSGIGVFDFKNSNIFEYRSINNNSSKVSVSLLNRTIFLDVDSSAIASEIAITDLDNISSPSTSNQYLKWNGSSYVWEVITPYSLSFRDTYNTNIGINDGSYLRINGNSPIEAVVNGGNQIDLNFNGGLSNLSDVDIVGAIPNTYVLAYNTSTSKWEPTAPNVPPSYSFYIKGDAITTDTVTNSSVLAILGDGIISTVLTGSNELTVGWTANLNDLSDLNAPSPSNNQVLTWNSTSSKWEAKNAATTTITANNGLTLSSNNVKLGGYLTEDTSINGSGNTFALDFRELEKFYVETLRGDHRFLFRSNDVQGYTEFTATNENTSLFYEMLFHTGGAFMSFQSSYGSAAKKWGIHNGYEYGSLIYQLSGNTRAGYIVGEDSITIHDGVNTPSAGHVLTYMADGTAQFKSATGSTLGADDWGVQVVEHDSTLTGDGTLASLLAVANPLPDGYSNGYYLTVEEGSPVWQPFPESELVALCEIENTSEVSVTTGKLFFTIPPQMHGWILKSYAASVYTLGSGGTTTIDLVKNAITISGSTGNIIATQYITVSSINNSVSTGDRISVNVTSVTKTGKDKGLSLTILFESS